MLQLSSKFSFQLPGSWAKRGDIIGYHLRHCYQKDGCTKYSSSKEDEYP